MKSASSARRNIPMINNFQLDRSSVVKTIENTVKKYSFEKVSSRNSFAKIGVSRRIKTEASPDRVSPIFQRNLEHFWTAVTCPMTKSSAEINAQGSS
jgi:hypothetical protein